MLQQTRVETVIPYFERFLAAFPTPLALAEATPDEVLARWSGLGYYRRARLLHEGARAVAKAGGEVPRARAELLGVPGIGRYTAGAIASIAFGEPVGLVDGNVARVLARLFAIEDDMRKAGMRKAEVLADELVAREDPGSWNQALMELGATVCTPRSPRCEACPARDECTAYAEGRVDVLPKLSPKKPPTAQRVQAVVAMRASDGAVLLARRKPDILFGGLWEPPMAEGAAASRAKLRGWMPVGHLARAGSIEHVLSHRKLTVDVLRGELLGTAAPAPPEGSTYDAVKVVRIDEIASLGISALAKKVLACGAGERG